MLWRATPVFLQMLSVVLGKVSQFAYLCSVLSMSCNIYKGFQSVLFSSDSPFKPAFLYITRTEVLTSADVADFKLRPDLQLGLLQFCTVCWQWNKWMSCYYCLVYKFTFQPSFKLPAAGATFSKYIHLHIYACMHTDIHIYMHINIFISQCPVSGSISASSGRAHLAIVENLAIYFSKESKYEGLILLSLNFKYKWQSKM